MSKAVWEKVIYLQPGDLIATASTVEPPASNLEPAGEASNNGLDPSTSNLEPYVLWSEIVSIEYVGKEQVYDIAVEGNRNFFGNGILAHNTYISGASAALGIGYDPATISGGS